jgi:hypothetical protein
MARKDAFKWLMGFATVVLVVIGAYWLIGNRHGSARAAPSPPRPPLPAPSSLSSVVNPRAAANGPNKTGGADIEICGIGRLAQKADDLGANDYVSDLNKPALKRWAAALRNSDDYRARASGILITTLLDDRHAQQRATQDARDELVAMAVGSADPAVYAIALKYCALTANDTPSTCNQLSAGGWARLDPDNAVPWLLAAGRAHQNQDMAAEAAAFIKASEAHKSSSYDYSLLEYAEPEMPPDTTPLQRWGLAIQVIGIEAAYADLQGLAASMHCSKSALQDKSVAQQCQALAELWTTRPETLLDLMRGTSLGKSVGWPAQRVEELRQRTQAYMQINTQATPSERDELWTCQGVEQGNAYVAKLARMGEIGTLGDLLERSGETVAELARKHAEAMEKMQREAQ